MPKSAFSRAYRQLLTLLIDARKAQELTQTDLAKRLGKPQSFVAKYEKGERRLDVVELLDVTEAIGTDIHRLIDAIRSLPRMP